MTSRDTNVYSKNFIHKNSAHLLCRSYLYFMFRWRFWINAPRKGFPATFSMNCIAWKCKKDCDFDNDCEFWAELAATWVSTLCIGVGNVFKDDSGFAGLIFRTGTMVVVRWRRCLDIVFCSSIDRTSSYAGRKRRNLVWNIFSRHQSYFRLDYS